MSKILCGALSIIATALPASAAYAGSAQGAATAAAASSCNISGKERKLGATYVTSVSATGVSCSSAIALVKAFHACRRKHGEAGKCSKVSGYRCSEKRDAIPTQYDSRATCTRGSRKVVQTYTQNT